MNGLIIVDQPRSGVWNMAIDRALAEYSRLHALCVLRLYQWQSPTLSLGYFQSYPTQEEHSDLTGLEIVRRETGGGAIIHDHDVTYSIVMPDRSEKGHASELYHAAHRAVIVWLNSVGVNADFYSNRLQSSCDNTCNNDRYLCFERRSDFDIVVSGYKILGSAQRRYPDVIMQHGSLLIQRSRFAPGLLGLADLATSPPFGSDANDVGFSPLAISQPFQLQKAMAEVLSGKLVEDFGIEWRQESLEGLPGILAENSHIEQFQSFDWAHRV
jgi:lipoyl(octanoyl) transferase